MYVIKRGRFKNPLHEDISITQTSVYRYTFQLEDDKSVCIKVSGKVPSLVSYLIYSLELEKHSAGGYRIVRIVNIERDTISKTECVDMLSKIQRHTTNTCCAYSLANLISIIVKLEDLDKIENHISECINLHKSDCLRQNFDNCIQWNWYKLCECYCLLLWLSGNNMKVWTYTAKQVSFYINVIKNSEDIFNICWLTTVISPRAIQCLYTDTPVRFSAFIRQEKKIQASKANLPDFNAVRSFVLNGYYIGKLKCPVDHKIEYISKNKTRIYNKNIYDKISQLREAFALCDTTLKTFCTHNEMFKSVRSDSDTFWTVIIPNISYKKYIVNTAKKPKVVLMNDIVLSITEKCNKFMIIGAQQFSYDDMITILKHIPKSATIGVYCVEIILDTLKSPYFYDISKKNVDEWNRIIRRVATTTSTITYDDLSSECKKIKSFLFKIDHIIRYLFS
jgi:hypothetical protein